MTLVHREDHPRRRSVPAVGLDLLPLSVLAAVLWLGCFWRLGSGDLFDLDEGLYGTVARQMAESGDWLVPRVASLPFFDKPPLTYWLQAASIHLFGPTPFAVRLPSAIAAGSTALLLGWWAGRRGLARIGWLAAIIYALCPLTIALARQATMDSLLTLWLTLAVIGWIAGHQGDRRGYLLMATAAGLATMTKGLVGLLLPGAAFTVWLLFRGSAREVRRVPWVAASLMYLAVLLPWHLAVWRASGPVFVREYIVHHHIQRFLGKDFGHQAPFWVYAPVLLVGLFPWSAFALRAWWQSLRAECPEREPIAAAWAIWALWAAVVVGFFSLSKSKLPGYVQPAAPALALLAAVRLESVWQKRRGLSAGEALMVGLTGLFLGGLFLAVGVLGERWSGLRAATLWGKTIPASVSVPVSLVSPVALILCPVLLVGVIAMLARWGSTPRVTGAAAALGMAFALLFVRCGLPAWSASDVQPLHQLAGRVLPDLQKGEPVVLYHFAHRRPSLRFHLGHTAQVHETSDPAILQQIVRVSRHGSILTARENRLPPLSVALRQEAAAGQWALWRWQTPPAPLRRLEER